jgi:NSS family neurotransmitter:Na+ symporter
LICLFARYRWKNSLDDELGRGDNGYEGSFTKRYVDISLATLIPIILLLVFINTVAQKYFAFTIIG